MIVTGINPLGITMNRTNKFGKLLRVFTMACAALSMHTSSDAAVIGPGDVGPTIKKPLDQVAFENYVAACKSELEIDAIPQLDCNDINFRNPDGTPAFAKSTDYVTHAKVNSVVDAVFACRWVHPNEGVNDIVPTGAIIAASGEMIVHNKVTGSTCFFKMKPANATKPIDGAVASNYERIATTNPASPTDPTGFSFWDTPSHVQDAACTQCHAAGPWIASPQIVGALTQFGLINDGHDTRNIRYTAIGSNGAKLNQFAADSVAIGAGQISGACAAACHSVAGYGLRGDDSNSLDCPDSPIGCIIIPSISRVIDDVKKANLMPPTLHTYSDYRWVNLDNPGGAGGDWERVKDLAAKYPQFACSNGIAAVQMHVVDSVRRLSTADFPDVLQTFNLVDGLVCNNADQTNGQCHDYQTRYHCPSGWTKWRNLSSVDGSGDNESRANFPGLCSDPTEIQARTTISGIDIRGTATVTGFGPPDRMQSFDVTHGVACRNASQPSGQCQDYTVRYICK